MWITLWFYCTSSKNCLSLALILLSQKVVREFKFFFLEQNRKPQQIASCLRPPLGPFHCIITSLSWKCCCSSTLFTYSVLSHCCMSPLKMKAFHNRGQRQCWLACLVLLNYAWMYFRFGFTVNIKIARQHISVYYVHCRKVVRKEKITNTF